MYLNISWHITIGQYRLMAIDSCEVHKSVDLLADTCVIKLPGAAWNHALQVEDKIKRGDKLVVQMGYDDNLQTEFEGYVQRIDTDDGSLTLNCEDELFLLRKAVKDKEFKATTVKGLAQYVIDQTGADLTLDCTVTIDYDKFVIYQAEGYDVLKKLQDETKCNIYIRAGVLHLHPLYTEKHGYVSYSFQQNIEKADLKYRRKDDRKVRVTVTSTNAKGEKVEESWGDLGGEKTSIEAPGMSRGSMLEKAKSEHKLKSYDGYEGSITGWLIPLCEPGYSVSIKDADYAYKDGGYYATAVTTSIDGSGGGQRKVQLGIKVN